MTAAAVLGAAVAFSGAHADASSVRGGSDVTASSGAGVLAGPDRRRIEQQRPLIAAASTIRWEIERHSYPGYAGIVLEDARVALWWKGALPAAMADVVARASKTAPVQVRAAAHSLAELRTAAATIEAKQTVGAHAVKLKADGSGLVVAVARPPGPARPGPRRPWCCRTWACRSPWCRRHPSSPPAGTTTGPVGRAARRS
jgi:hypothetical protein